MTLRNREREIRRRTRCNDRGCWIWQGPIQRKSGHGRIGQRRLVHVVAYEIWRGSVPQGAIVEHKCAEPACCNPMHLRLGTKSMNTLHAYARKHGQMSKRQLRVARHMHDEVGRKMRERR